MSIQDFLVKLESGQESSSLFVTLRRLRRLGSLRDLVHAAAGDPSGLDIGWVSWQDLGAESVDGAATVRA